MVKRKDERTCVRIYTVMCRGDIRRGLDWRTDLLTNYRTLTTNKCNTVTISALYSSLEHPI
jgi:hypothetical protein